MSEKVLHSTRIELLPALPAQIVPGAVIKSRVRLVCPFGCNLKGHSVLRLDGDALISSHKLAVHRTGGNETEAVTFRAPEHASRWGLKFSFDGAEGEVADHAPCDAEFAVDVSGKGEVTIAAWSIPEAIFIGDRLTFKVGAKSSTGASLAGVPVFVRDEASNLVASTVLGIEDVAATSLYSAEVTASAPAIPCEASWLIEIDGSGLDVPLAGEPFRVRFVVRPRPDSVARVRVIDEATRAGVPDASVKIVGVVGVVPMSFSGRTDHSGLVEIEVPAGRFVAKVWRPDYQASSPEIHVSGVVEVEIRAKHQPRKRREEVWM